MHHERCRKLWNQAPKDIKLAPKLAIAMKKSSSTAKHYQSNPESEETTEKIGGKTCHKQFGETRPERSLDQVQPAENMTASQMEYKNRESMKKKRQT